MRDREKDSISSLSERRERIPGRYELSNERWELL
jgi:hypothetical protein